MFRHIVFLSVFAVAFSGSAAANGKPDLAACRAMQAALVPRQSEVTGLAEQREATALKAEEAGLAWEDAETHRLISAGHAAAADAHKADYDNARKQLAREEMALQATLKQFNADVAIFNAQCSSKG